MIGFSVGLFLGCAVVWAIVLFGGVRSAAWFRLSADRDIGIVVLRAGSVAQRIVGLLNHVSLAEGEGLWIPRARVVHTQGMKFSIDLVWLSPDFHVLRIDAEVVPGCSRLQGPPGASGVIELYSGYAQVAGLACGLALTFTEIPT